MTTRCFLIGALLTAACSTDKFDPPQSEPVANTPDGDDTGQQTNDSAAPADDTGEPADDTGEPADDTGEPDDTGAPATEWTPGPELPECTPVEADTSLVALSGVLLLPEGPVAGEVVYDRDSGEIVCAGSDDCDVGPVTRICTEGIISPGLIDSHNHMQYNVLPPWQHGEEFSDRYEWRNSGAYRDYRTAYDVIDSAYECEIMKWAELRSLMGGATSVVGSTGGACINPLVRNLDEGAPASGISGYVLYYSASTVTDRFEEGDTIEPGSYFDAVANHVGEGVDGSVTDEISHMMNIGMEGPGQIYVHATDATTAQLARMADEGTSIAWSPRSNLDLYSATTPADVAHRLGVPLTLSPDWTWSGSMNPARELHCASEWLKSRNSSISDATLWSWVTGNAAQILRIDHAIGSLAPGLRADIAVFDWSNEPYRTVIEADPRSLRLVMIDGNALAGHAELVEPLTEEWEWCESVVACEGERTVCAQAGWAGDNAQTASEIEATLASTLGAVSMPDGLDYASEVLGLFACEEERASCDISEPTTDDADGDGIADTADSCPSAYNPLQADEDGDAVGDVCDPCPLAADRTDCTHTPGDIDGDGIASSEDICPYLYDADQADRDEDGHGDVCDLCPDEPNPGDSACTFSIADLRDPTRPLHPAEGTSVTVAGAIVTGINEGRGFYIQDPEATTFGGLYVYGAGSITDGGLVSTGDQIRISGVYTEYYGMTQIGSPTVTVTGTASMPEPIEVDDTCSVGTGGELAEALEGMLIRVSDIDVTNSNPDAPSDYGEFEVNECLRVDDQLSEVLVPQPEEGAHFESLSGVLTYTYSNSKLEPRGAEDVAE